MEANQDIAEWFDEKAHSLDLYLSGRRYTEKVNETQAVISNESLWEEGGKFSNSTNFNLSLRLPNLEEEYQLMFSNYDPDRRHRSSYSRQDGTVPEEENYGASLGFLKQFGDVNTTFQPRLELKDPLATSYLLRFETSVDQDQQAYEFRLEFFADSEKGAGVFFSADHYLDLSQPFLLVSSFENQYQDDGNLYKTLEALSLRQKLDDNKSLSYSSVFRSDNRPVFHLTSISCSVSFSHRLYSEALHYSVVLSQVFAKANNFKGRSFSGFNIDLIF